MDWFLLHLFWVRFACFSLTTLMVQVQEWEGKKLETSIIYWRTEYRTWSFQGRVSYPFLRFRYLLLTILLVLKILYEPCVPWSRRLSRVFGVLSGSPSRHSYSFTYPWRTESWVSWGGKLMKVAQVFESQQCRGSNRRPCGLEGRDLTNCANHLPFIPKRWWLW